MSLRLETPLIAALAATLALSACKDVDRDQPAETLALAAFDPGQAGVRAANIPLPNDLALQGAPSQTSATRDVLFSFIQDDGFTGDQTISIPVRSIVRDPETRTYGPSPTPPAALDASTINASTVAIVRVSDSPPTVLEPEFLGYGPRAGSPGFNEIRLRPRGGMPPGRYVVALRGGSRGVKTAEGQALGADQAIMLLAPNKDLSNPEFQPPGGLDAATVSTLERLRAFFRVPLDWGQPPGDGATRTAICRQALGIPAEVPLPEQTCWLPPLNQNGELVPTAGITPAYDAVDLVFPHGQLVSLQTFEVAAPAVIVDSATGVVPFPSDFLLDGATGRVRNIPSLGPAAPGLATLDGFSTTSLQLVPLSAPVKASTVTRENVLFFEITGGGGLRQLVDVAAAAQGAGPAEYLTQPPNLVQTVGGTGVSTAIGLQPAVPVPVSAETTFHLPPLEPKTRYLVVVTDGVTDVADRPLKRGTLARLLYTISSDIANGEGASNVPSLTDAEAQGLQAIRNALRPIVQNLEANVLGGKKVVMAYTVTTQDVKTVSANLTALPYNVEQAAGGPFFVTTDVADFDPTAAPFGLPAAAFGNVARFVSGNLATLDVLSSTTGALDPAVSTWGPEQFAANRRTIPFLVAIPQAAVGCTPQTCAAPLVVFHHGLGGSHYQMLLAADALAAEGFVVAAIDAPFHGERASCQENADCAGGATCTIDPANQKAPGTCSGGAELAFDSSRLTTVASGNYFISENFFRIRDAIRQDLLDHSALVLAAARPGGTDALAQAIGAAGLRVDATDVSYAGLSLGGMIGTSLVATNPRIGRAVLNVPGGTLVDVFTNAPAFRDDVGALLANLIPGFTFDRVTPVVDGQPNPAFDPAIAQRYAQTLIVAKWVLDPAEPINYAADVTTKDASSAALRSALGPLAESGADVYGQMIEGDPVVPNPFNALLFENAGIDFAFYTTTTVPVENRHGLLLAPNAQGAFVRSDLVKFLADPSDASISVGPTALP